MISVLHLQIMMDLFQLSDMTQNTIGCTLYLKPKALIACQLMIISGANPQCLIHGEFSEAEDIGMTIYMQAHFQTVLIQEHMQKDALLRAGYFIFRRAVESSKI